jgi:hypothetical protein
MGEFFSTLYSLLKQLIVLELGSELFLIIKHRYNNVTLGLMQIISYSNGPSLLVYVMEMHLASGTRGL